MSVSGRSEMTTAAAWIEALRAIPSSPRATSTICLATGSFAYSAGEVGAWLQALLEARRAAHDRVRDQLRQPVPHAVVMSEDAGGVPRRRAREHLAERDDLGHAVGAVLVGHVADHALAAADGEVDVDVRHRHALGVEEALEQQVVAQRIDVGDLQAVGDEAAGGAAAARADGDPVVLRVLHEVPDDQEVGVEAHVVDDAELHLHALDRLGGRRVAVAAVKALRDQLAQVLVLALAVRAVEARISCLPSSISTSQRSAISSDEASASCMSANDGRHLLEDLRKNSFVSKLIFGCASVDFVCTHSSAAWWW